MQVVLRSTLSSILCISTAAQFGGAQVRISVPEPANGSPSFRIERDSKLSLVLAEAVSSETAKKGQRVRMKLAEPWIADGHVILPAGAPAFGVVGRVRRAVHGKKNGHVDVSTGSIELPSGQRVPLNLWMPDREDCDGAEGACVALGVLFVIVAAPILAIELPVILAHPKKLRQSFRQNPEFGGESFVSTGSVVGATTTRMVRLRAMDMVGPSEAE